MTMRWKLGWIHGWITVAATLLLIPHPANAFSEEPTWEIGFVWSGTDVVEGGEYIFPLNSQRNSTYTWPGGHTLGVLYEGAPGNAVDINSHSMSFSPKPELDTFNNLGHHFVVIFSESGFADGERFKVIEWFRSGTSTDPLAHPPNQWGIIRFEVVSEITEPDPVIVVPGILGSWEKNGEFVIDPVLHTYDDLIETFKLNGFVEGETIFPFPYDWRKSNAFTGGLLRNKINEVQEVCDCEKVDIIAHSMGGLVARYYIQSGLYEGDIDQLIFIGTPHLGSVESYLTWEGGQFKPDKFNFLKKRIFSNEAKENGFGNLFDYIQNSPIISIQQLLPTFDYIRDKGEVGLRAYPNDYPRNGFLEDLNSNVSLLLDSGVDMTNIVGNFGSSSTISALRVVDSSELPKWEHGYPENFDDEETDQGLEFGNGDGTVPSASAYFIEVNINEFPFQHSALVKETQSFVYKELTGDTPSRLSDGPNFLNVPLLFLKVFSPVDVQVVAPSGQKIGKDFDSSDELDEIEGAFYSGFETESEYLTIPDPENGAYKIVVQGTGSGGEYSIIVGYISDGVLVEREITSHILPDSFEEITYVSDNTFPESSDIEDTTEMTLEILLAHIEQAYEIGWILEEDYKTNLTNIINAIISSTADNQDTLLDVFLKRLENGLKDGFINENGFNLLEEDVNLLIQ